MSTPAPDADVTSLLQQAHAGDAGAEARVFELLFRDLRSMAHARLRRMPQLTLADTGMLVNECWMRLHGQHRVQFNDRSHFLAYAARAMRSIVVDLARQRQAEQRGGDQAKLTLDTDLAQSIPADEPAAELVELDEALAQLARLDPRLARIVEMRFFAGLTQAQIGEALGLTERTIRRDWDKARAFLALALKR